MALSGYGFVKEVLSGDTLVIIGQPRDGPPPELKLTLASLQAPRLALKPTTMSATNLTTKDQEPFAWESRQFLRELCIGKKVFFKVEYTVQSINRQFGAVYLLEPAPANAPIKLFATESSPNSGRLGENVCLTVAREGWCSVRVREKQLVPQGGQVINGDKDNEKSADLDEMIALSKEAEEQGRGVFSKDKDAAAKSVRTVKWDFMPQKSNSNEEKGDSDVEKFYDLVKDKPQKAIIEYIRDGASMKALLLDSMTLITFNLAGVQCPRMNMGSSGSSDPQEYGQEAKFFTEVRLLNRLVELNINGLNKNYATFYGVVNLPGKPKGIENCDYNISVELVKNGLGMPTDWSMSYTTPSNAAKMHAAVHVAKNAKLRLWKNYAPPVIPGDKSYSGVVAEVVSGDTLVVRVGNADDLYTRPWSCEERKIHLSSIRAPRLSRNEKSEPFATAAKEFLRSKLIGKEVSVDVEYVVEGGGQARKYGTVMLSGKKSKQNVAALLLEAGLATIIGHKQGAERSQFYHELIEAERLAQEGKKNLWDASQKANATENKPVELVNQNLAKSYLPTLKSENFDKRVPAVVDYVINGCKLKLYVPSQDVILSMNLAGVQAPNVHSKGKDGKLQKNDDMAVYAEQSLALTKALCLQQNVEFLVENVDKGGNFIGTVFVKRSAKRLKNMGKYGGTQMENLAVLTLQSGLATVSRFGIKFAKYGMELKAEEKNARDARVGVWEKYVESNADEENELESQRKPKKENTKPLESFSVVICHINNANEFYVQVRNEKEDGKTKTIEAAMEKFGQEFGLEPAKPADAVSFESLKKDQNIIALFHDGEKSKWYRAKIVRVGTDKVLVKYVDFGNEEEIKPDRIKIVGDSGVFQIEPLAYEATLVFVDAPDVSEDFGVDAAMYLSQLSTGKTLTAKLHSKDVKTNTLIITLLPAGKSLGDAEEAGDAKEKKEDLVTVNGLLLREGLAIMPKRVRPYVYGSKEENDIIEQLKKDQEIAHDSRMNMWSYGDPRPEDDDRF